MEAKDLVFLAGGVGGCIAIYLAMWLMALRMRKPALRRVGTRVSLVSLAVVAAYGLSAYTRNAAPPDFVTEVPGPARGQGSTLREVKFPVTDLGARQIVELTMKAESVAQGVLALTCRVVDPAGNQLAMSEQKVSPGEGRLWLPMRFEFEAEHSGDHKLIVEIPQNVDMMRVVVKEQN